jgi:hypothetical protein
MQIGDQRTVIIRRSKPSSLISALSAAEADHEMSGTTLRRNKQRAPTLKSAGGSPAQLSRRKKM